MGEKSMESIINQRREKRKRVIEESKQFVKCVQKHYNVITAYLIGSYARGDFNIWSDIDIVIIVEKAPESPLDRLENIKNCIRKHPDIEPIIITKTRYEKLKTKKNPITVEIEKTGIKLI